MVKRLNDTSKWTNNRWFQRLPKQYKLLWMYIWDICDNVGVWSADFDLAMRMTDCTFTEDEALERFGSHIEILEEETKTWWIVEFCQKQYKFLDENSKSPWVIANIDLLKEHGIYERYIGYIKGIYTPIYKKGKGKEKKGKERTEYAPSVHMAPDEYDKLVELIGKDNTRRCIDKISHYKGASGKTYKSDYRAILNWTVKEVTGKDPTDWEADKERKQEEERKNGEKKQEQRTKEPIPEGARESLQLLTGSVGKSMEDGA